MGRSEAPHLGHGVALPVCSAPSQMNPKPHSDGVRMPLGVGGGRDMSVVIPWQQVWPRCSKCQQPQGPCSRWRGHPPQCHRAQLCCCLALWASLIGTKQGRDHKELSHLCRQALTASPSPSPRTDPACPPGDISGASRVQSHKPVLWLFHVSPRALPKQGDVALLPPLTVLLHGLLGSCTCSHAGKLKVYSATLRCRCSAVAGQAHLYAATDRGHRAAASPALEGSVQRHITLPRHCRQNPYIMTLTGTLARYQICPQALSQK